MVLKTSFTLLAVATLALFSSNAPQAEAHSWVDCVDWKFKDAAAKKKQDWSEKGGSCKGYARRFPLGKAFGSLDSDWPSRHYHQNLRKNTLPCSDKKAGLEKGADETRDDKDVTKAYGGKYGVMTVTSVGDELCIRWPAKNHADPKSSSETTVDIYLTEKPNQKDPTKQSQLTKNFRIAGLRYRNCVSGSNQDRRACGGCFKVPKRSNGVYLLQWRWRLNQRKNSLDDEYYTSCADVKIVSNKK
ncbi:hypothetical protein BGZ65_010971 [Modicella reniformis]|uniref:Secreted protein n=1 Tax=Modicella reniformis TaxID=1440133 RepID=A0A9P6INR8_9FUNG|nr:hypothetical protein BGZ65_010971 [Modicella reniformis]